MIWLPDYEFSKIKMIPVVVGTFRTCETNGLLFNTSKPGFGVLKITLFCC